jgi:hypothetical protein
MKRLLCLLVSVAAFLASAARRVEVRRAGQDL